MLGTCCNMWKPPRSLVTLVIPGVIEKLNLKKCCNTVVGSPGLVRGISGGERKRTNVALSLLGTALLCFSCDKFCVVMCFNALYFVLIMVVTGNAWGTFHLNASTIEAEFACMWNLCRISRTVVLLVLFFLGTQESYPALAGRAHQWIGLQNVWLPDARCEANWGAGLHCHCYNPSAIRNLFDWIRLVFSRWFPFSVLHLRCEKGKGQNNS